MIQDTLASLAGKVDAREAAVPEQRTSTGQSAYVLCNWAGGHDEQLSRLKTTPVSRGSSLATVRTRTPSGSWLSQCRRGRDHA